MQVIINVHFGTLLINCIISTFQFQNNDILLVIIQCYFSLRPEIYDYQKNINIENITLNDYLVFLKEGQNSLKLIGC